MSAIEALRMARENGVRFRIAGADLILDADREPSPRVLEAIRRHKAGIVALLSAPGSDWSAEDWRAFFDERAGIGEHDGGLSRADAEARAYECCTTEWMNQNPAPSDTDRCAWCGEPDVSGSAVLPFGTETHGHTWLHPQCWNQWYLERRLKAQQALAAMGLRNPVTPLTPSGHAGPTGPAHTSPASVIGSVLDLVSELEADGQP